MAPTAAAAASGEGEFFRLPTNVKPLHYDLLISSDLKALKFAGLVTVHLEVLEDTKTIVFNAGKKLSLGKAEIKGDALKTESKDVVALAHDKDHERATATLAVKIQKGSKVTITTAFEAEIDASMMGFYRSSWEHEGKKGYYALTQFEPTAARRAYPCWDEPSLKATYSVKMLHRKGTTALCNMPSTEEKDLTYAQAQELLRLKEFDVTPVPGAVVTEKLGDAVPEPEASESWRLTTFDKLPLVSSYLVTWSNGEYEVLSSETKSPISGKVIPLRIFTTPEYIHQAQYALDVTAKVLPELISVFDCDYPLPKLDTLVAADFDAGAMEGWGLITGRTSVYLYEEGKSGLQGQKTTAGVQSHEISHQHFGNLVTLAWWDCLWLNEAFATLMGEVIILDRCFPEWESASEFVVQHLARALELDSKRSSHPIEVPLKGDNVEDAINQVFDAISYSKGASVLRMLSNMIGEETFLKGVSIYIKKHAFGNAKTEDLWAGISEASGLDVPKIMNNWILKIGHPVITVTEEADAIHVKQNRFLSTGDVKPDEDETLWYVPLGLKTVEGGSAKVHSDVVLDQVREQRIPLKGAKEASWKLNAETTGVFRVAYSPERLAKLGAEAAKADSAFSREDKIGLVSDSFTLAKAGYSKTSGGLALLDAIRGDSTYLVNSSAALNLGSLASVWFEQEQEVRDGIDAFRAAFFAPKAKKLTFEYDDKDTPDVRQLRTVVISGAAAGNDAWTLGGIKERFARYVKGDEKAVHPDLLRCVFGAAVKHGGKDEYEQVLDVYRKPPTPTHKIAAMLAMCSTRDEALLRQTVDFLFKTKEVKDQDAAYYVMGLASNPLSRRMLWAATKDNYEAIIRRFEGNFALGRLIEYSLNGLTTDEDLEDVERFFKDKNTSRYSMSLAQGKDALVSNSRWLKRDANDVRDFLAKSGYLKK